MAQESKTYRPKAEYEGFALTANLGQGVVVDLKSSDFPYTTEDQSVQAYLDGREELTDRPAPKVANTNGKD